MKIDVIHALSTLPATDCNFLATLKDATDNQIRIAIERMDGMDGCKGRITACARELRRRAKHETI